MDAMIWRHFSVVFSTSTSTARMPIACASSRVVLVSAARPVSHHCVRHQEHCDTRESGGGHANANANESVMV